MSLDEEITRPKQLSPKGRMEDMPKETQPLHESLHSTCPICLGTFDNMLYLSPCLHSFCFLCTRDLLETKTECPFCKQPFNSVFHPVKAKGHPKELPSLSPTRQGSSPGKKRSSKSRISLSPSKQKEGLPVPPTEEHPKELYIHLHDRRLSEDPISLASKDKSPPKSLSRPLSSPDQKKCPLSKRGTSTRICSHEAYSIKASAGDASSPGGFANHRCPQKCPHWSVLENKPDSDEASSGSTQEEKAQSTTAGSPKFGDCDLDGLYYKAESAELSRPNFLEGAVMLFSSGLLLFVCLYAYLSLILLYK